MKKNERLSNLMKLLSLTIMLVFISPVMTHAQAGKTNFSGSWAVNAEKSTQPQGGGGGMRMGGGNIVVKQEANLLTVDRTRPGRDGGAPQTTTMKYTLDGKESVNTSQRGDSKSTATWSADGKTLTIATSRTFDSGTMKSTEVWTLTDAKTLTMKSSMTTPNGDRTSTYVYDKK